MWSKDKENMFYKCVIVIGWLLLCCFNTVIVATNTSDSTATPSSSLVANNTTTSATTATSPSASVNTVTSTGVTTAAITNTTSSASIANAPVVTNALDSSNSTGDNISADITASRDSTTNTTIYGTITTTAVITTTGIDSTDSSHNFRMDTSSSADRISNYTTYSPTSSTSKTTDQIISRASRPADPNTEHKAPPSFVMPVENLEILISFQVEYTKLESNNILMNSTCGCNNQTEKEVREQLELAFNITTGFTGITIKECSTENVSIDVSFTASFKNVSSQKLKDELNKNVYRNLNNSTWNVISFTQAVENGLSEICKGELNKCPRDYTCINTNVTLCEHLCAHPENVCLHRGYCVVNTEYKPVCRCPDDDNFVYSGEKCEEKTEKLALSKENIIAIAAGVGGGIILILVIVIIIVSKRKALKRRLQKDNVLDNVSEQSYKSFRSSEDGIHQPGTQGNDSRLGFDNPMYRLSEERAENPRFNPYLPRPKIQSQVINIQSQVINTPDNAQGFTATDRRAGNRQRNGRSEPLQFNDRVPNYGDPVQLPQSHHAPSRSNRLEIDTGPPRPYVHQPTKTKQPQRDLLHPPKEVKIYDYYRHYDPDATGSHNDTDLYDFNYENSNRQELGINDPYSIKRTDVLSQRQF